MAIKREVGRAVRPRAARARARGPVARGRGPVIHEIPEFKGLGYMKSRKWPSSSMMEKAPVVSIIQMKAKQGRESALESELLQSFEAVKGQPGIARAGVYRLLRGTEGAPGLVLMLVAKNPGVFRRLEKNSSLKARQNKIQDLADDVSMPSVNATLIGRVDE